MTNLTDNDVYLSNDDVDDLPDRPHWGPHLAKLLHRSIGLLNIVDIKAILILNSYHHKYYSAHLSGFYILSQC